MQISPSKMTRFSKRLLTLGLALPVVGLGAYAYRQWAAAKPEVDIARAQDSDPAPAPSSVQAVALESETHGGEQAKPILISLSEEEQKTVGLRTTKVVAGNSPQVLSAPGQVVPNELQYAFITSRAAGVIRTVNAHVGQTVRAGDLLATIDSPSVGEARLELYTKLQQLEVAKAQADWEEMIFRNTNELISHLRDGESPEEIQRHFVNRAVGENRERLMTAYAQYRLAVVTLDRNRELNAQKLITPKQFQEVTATYEVALATYQSLMDQMGYEVKLANTRARQAKHQAETAVRTAQERLRILGVKSDGTEPDVADGKVVGVQSDGTLPPREDSKPILPGKEGEKPVAVKPVGVPPEAKVSTREAPVSTYSIWAPFDGIILDREMIVPGVAVDTTHRLFTLANLSSVWVEASIHEGDFATLDRSHAGTEIRFRSPAYPDHVFEGTVIYSGDLVDEKSRTVKLLAKAENPARLLKPGMFVEAEILSPRKKPALQIPTSALLEQGGRTFVYVKQGRERFVRRDVDAEAPQGNTVTILDGLHEGDEVVVEGEFKLKAISIQLASAKHD